MNKSQVSSESVYRELLDRVGEANPRPRIEPVRRLAELSGSPEKSYPIIQVAGTNGKTSTARIIESLLRSFGLRTGLLTSPHLIHFTERIQIDGEPISPELLEEVWTELQVPLSVVDEELAQAGQGPITFFEALTVLTYSAFADAPVEIAVVEVGMGGEWDATNIADASVAVFTPIDFDHTSILGETLADIARTKSRIIKSGSTVVTAAQQPEAFEQLEDQARQTDARLFVAGEHFRLEENRGGVGGRLVELRGLSGKQYEPTYVPLFGAHQAENVLLGVAAVEAFIGSTELLPQQVLEEGLANVRSPGRLEMIGQQPTVLVDSAHNAHGASALAAALDESFDFDEVTLVFGALQDKDVTAILSKLTPHISQLFLTPVHSDRSADIDSLSALVEEHHPELLVTSFDSLREALEEGRAWATEAPARGILVTGSVLLAGEAIAYARTQPWGKSSG